MGIVVLDTSVVVKWFINEQDAEQASTYLRCLLGGELKVAAPSSMPFELANALWSRRRDGLTRPEILAIWQDFAAIPLLLTEGSRLLPRALDLGDEHEVSPYDAVFVALAEHLRCNFVTADRKLWRRLSSQFPNIKLLSDEPSN